MKKIAIGIIALTLTLGVTSCKENKETDTLTDETSTEIETTNEVETSIQLEKLENSPAYSDAILKLNEPQNTDNLTSGDVDFDFQVENYNLSEITNSSNTEKLANSDKGQHIHFILNNEPYSAHYDSSFTKEIPDGVHHLVAFLSRSYHESVKNDNSVVVRKLTVGKDAVDEQGLQMEEPTLIYSRPKGTYTGKDAKNILLDFFVLNTELSESGSKVKATINGKEFMINEWSPYVLTGLPMGEVTIELELIDADGNYIEGPFNKVSRTITLSE